MSKQKEVQKKNIVDRDKLDKKRMQTGITNINDLILYAGKCNKLDVERVIDRLYKQVNLSAPQKLWVNSPFHGLYERIVREEWDEFVYDQIFGILDDIESFYLGHHMPDFDEGKKHWRRMLGLREKFPFSSLNHKIGRHVYDKIEKYVTPEICLNKKRINYTDMKNDLMESYGREEWYKFIKKVGDFSIVQRLVDNNEAEAVAFKDIQEKAYRRGGFLYSSNGTFYTKDRLIDCFFYEYLCKMESSLKDFSLQGIMDLVQTNVGIVIPYKSFVILSYGPIEINIKKDRGLYVDLCGGMDRDMLIATIKYMKNDDEVFEDDIRVWI